MHPPGSRDRPGNVLDAVETRPGTNPDRASFTTALQAARDQLINAGPGPHLGELTDLLGVIGRAVLATLLPARRARYSARKVKCATSRYLNRDDGRPAASTAVAAIALVVHTPPLDLTPRSRLPQPAPAFPGRRPAASSSPRCWAATPARAWTGAELAERLQVPRHNMLTQLSEWARLGFIGRTGPGSYALLARSPPVPG